MVCEYCIYSVVPLFCRYFCRANASEASPATDSNSNYGPCIAGHYCPNGTADPVPCADGTYMEDVQASECLLCPPGKYCITGHTPDDCPAGFFCKNGSCLLLRCVTWSVRMISLIHSMEYLYSWYCCFQVLDKCGSHALLELSALKQGCGRRFSALSVQEVSTVRSSMPRQSLGRVTLDTTARLVCASASVTAVYCCHK